MKDDVIQSVTFVDRHCVQHTVARRQRRSCVPKREETRQHGSPRTWRARGASPATVREYPRLVRIFIKSCTVPVSVLKRTETLVCVAAHTSTVFGQRAVRNCNQGCGAARQSAVFLHHPGPAVAISHTVHTFYVCVRQTVT